MFYPASLFTNKSNFLIFLEKVSIFCEKLIYFLTLGESSITIFKSKVFWKFVVYLSIFDNLKTGRYKFVGFFNYSFYVRSDCCQLVPFNSLWHSADCRNCEKSTFINLFSEKNLQFYFIVTILCLLKQNLYPTTNC